MLTEGLMTNTETVSNSVTTISTTSTSSKDRTLSTRTNQESSPVSGIQTTGLHSTADTLTNKAQFTVKMVSPNPNWPRATQTSGAVTTDDTGARLGGKSAPIYLFGKVVISCNS